MSIFAGRLSLALVAAALSLGARMACAQTAAVTFSSWPIGFGSNLTVGQNSNIYGSLSSFDGSDVRGGGFSYMRTNFPNGWFIGSERDGLGLNGINQAGAFGRSLYYEGTQFGYNFQAVRGLPLTVYAGFDTLKYNGIRSPFAPFDTVSGTVPGFRAHAGIEYQPAPNVSLSLGFGYTQQSGRVDSDINSLPGASPFDLSGRR
jgi:opacity protein-like surface antigen